MRGVQIILLLMVVQLSKCRETHWRKQGYVHNYFDEQGCAQTEPNCEECLAKGQNCEWCSDGVIRSECIKQGSETCPHEQRKTTCNTQTAEDDRKATVLEYHDKSLDELQAMADAPAANISVDNGSVVTVNASVFCGRQGGCNNCTSHEFCSWCEGKQTCQVYYNASTTEQSCSKNESAYKDQCIYPIGVIPCIERKNCKACAQEDWLCYWCPSTAKCFRYASHNSQPADCPGDKWYVQDCPAGGGIGLMWVLIPILAIILIPIIIYIIIWLVCCCMRAAGYEPLEPAESAKKKHPKGIRLRAGSPSNKTDELRKKYDLNNP